MKIGGIKQFIKYFENINLTNNDSSYKAQIHFKGGEGHSVLRSFYDKSIVYENGIIEIYEKDGEYIIFDAAEVYKITICKI